MEKRIATVGLG